MSTVCDLRTPLESAVSSFSRCQLYYDFTRGPQQRINHSIFSENAFNGKLFDGQYLYIANTSHRIGSNSMLSFDQYSVLFDVEFTESVNIGYFWSADSTSYLNVGSWHREQYQFMLKDGKLGISNKQIGPHIISNEEILINQRYLIIYKSSPDSAELFINGHFADSKSINNHGVYSPYYIKLGGSDNRENHFQPMKVYRYAIYGYDLKSSDIKEICNISEGSVIQNTNEESVFDMHVFGFLPIFLIPLCVTMIIVVLGFMMKHRKQMEKKRKKRVNKAKEEEQHSERTLVKRCNTNNECVICMSNVKEYICTPCGHYCLCHECSNKVKKCPLCQTKCKSIIKVYK